MKFTEFESEKISEHITKITVSGGATYVYLIEGDDKAVLIDTGWGLGDLRSYVESLTSKPYTVLLSHGHIDHVMGAGLFDEVEINEKDVNLYPTEYRPRYVIENFMHFSEDAKKIKMADFNCYQTIPFKTFKDGDRWDLGNLHILAINVQGHTPGMTMFLIEEERIMFYGDGCTKHTFMFTNGVMNISEYLEGLKYLKTFDDRYDTVIRSHNDYTQPKCVLDESIELCQQILNHTDAHLPVVIVGEHVYAAAKVNEKQQRLDAKLANIYYTDAVAK